MFDGNDFVNPMMGGFGFHLVGIVLYGLFMLVVVAVSVGLTIILVRYLLITTKAAQLYIVKNSPANASPVVPAAAPSVAKAATTATPATTTTPKVATPATPAKARAPKTPPVS
jgi:cytoskeletal protein RodZ